MPPRGVGQSTPGAAIDGPQRDGVAVDGPHALPPDAGPTAAAAPRRRPANTKRKFFGGFKRSGMVAGGWNQWCTLTAISDL